MTLFIKIKPFTFSLKRALKTAQGTLTTKKGWLLKITNSSNECGWGEIAPIDPFEIDQCEGIINKLNSSSDRKTLENHIKYGPGALGFGIGSALAELDYANNCKCHRFWLEPPKSAVLLTNDKSFFLKLDSYIESSLQKEETLTLKWKVAIQNNDIEIKMLSKILERLPFNFRLRLDANSGWDRAKATEWANYLINDVRLEWMEQPLPAGDITGLKNLSKIIPVALDESLSQYPSLRNSWRNWQIRHPTLEGDPRILLRELKQGKTNIAISTAFETGIGRRWVNHLAALQQTTLTPTAPGLAPGWRPSGNLFSNNPNLVWEAA